MKRDYVPLFASICTSEKLADLKSDSHRLFYVLLLAQCDAWGRIEASPRVLNARVWPMLGHSSETTDAAIRDLESVGLIEVHTSGSTKWAQVPNWDQKAGSVGHSDRRGASAYPEPSPDSLRTHSGLSPRLVPSEERRSEQRRTEQSRSEESYAAAGAPAPPPHPPKPRKVRSQLQAKPKPDKPPNPDHATFIAFWSDLFAGATGSTYPFAGAKDGEHVKRILERVGLEQAQRLATVLMLNPPEWVMRGGGGVDLGKLEMLLGQLASQGLAPASGSRQLALDLAMGGAKLNGHAHREIEIESGAAALLRERGEAGHE